MNTSVIDTASSANGEELRAFIERFERLDAEKKDLADAQKEVMAEAKGRGYDIKIIRKLIAMRKRDKDDLAGQSDALKQANSKLRKVSYFEIRARVQRSTPLVFATANASESALNLLDPSMASFDIAIIDEAAKGWSIDLVVPISIAHLVGWKTCKARSRCRRCWTSSSVRCSPSASWFRACSTRTRSRVLAQSRT